MKPILLDTHCWIWAVSTPELLNRDAAELIEEPENAFVLSAVSALEIAIKWARGTLELPVPPAEYIAGGLETMSMESLPVYLQHAVQVAELPMHHRDPFDRLLVAQAQIENLPLMTADPVVAKYDVDIIWAGKGRPPRRGQRRRQAGSTDPTN